MEAKRRKEPTTVLGKLFLKRVQEEMDRQALSRNALCKREGAPPQTTFNDVMNGADPKLETVNQIAAALNVPAWSLLVESDLVRQRTPERRKIFSFPSYPRIFGDRVRKTARRASEK